MNNIAPHTSQSTRDADSVYFSVLIVNWNGTDYLDRCLTALRDQSFDSFEVLLLDNNSPQPTPSGLESQYSELNLVIIRSSENLGFAAGNNKLESMARGKYVVLLNTDAFPEPDWLEIVHAATVRYPGSFFASRLISAKDPQLLDGEWNIYHASGLAWRRNHTRSISLAFPRERRVFSACAAAGVYPRESFEAVSGFDEDFFAYMEDVDLDFRLQLSGCKGVYLPNAVVRHVGAGSTSSRSSFMLRHGHRNLIWTFVKNMPGFLFWLLLPAHILVNLAYLALSFLMKNGVEIRKGQWEAVRGIKATWAKRKQIQSSRNVSTCEIARLLDWNPFSPLIKFTFK